MDAQEKAKEAFEKAQKKFLFSDVEFTRAIEMPEMTILLCTGKIGSLIGRNGVIVAELSKELDSKVRVVENTKNAKKLVADTIGNARLLGVDETYTKEGTNTTIRIHKNDRHKLATKPEHLEKALEGMLGTKTRIEFG